MKVPGHSAGLPGNDLLFLYCVPSCLPAPVPTADGAGRDPAYPAKAGRGMLRSTLPDGEEVANLFHDLHYILLSHIREKRQ